MRNLLRDLKSNLLDNGMFRREFEKILKGKRLSDKLCGEPAQVTTAPTQPDGHALARTVKEGLYRVPQPVTHTNADRTRHEAERIPSGRK
ncbi:hypothetical protein EXE55_15620 [Burkholderia glumae]|nr:hypothetical protein [Burkholderia glumae]QHE09600.1 hypothetical protein GQR88_03830 [Burkholderia glumae AU6208]QHP92248.1 hypothetical protein EXE55_15620 [Burkholderia glumae]UVS97504.1 hypothetical protein EFP19_05660 [Burkholderia glumae]